MTSNSAHAVDENKKYTIKKFEFKDADTTQQQQKQAIEIQIAELCLADYGFYIWPSSLILAQYIYFNSEKFKGKNILELGCGTSLSGILAYKVKANIVLLSDKLAYDCTLPNDAFQGLIDYNLSLNSCLYGDRPASYIKLIRLDWGVFNRNLFENLPKLDVLIGADVFFDSKLFEDLIATVKFLVEFNNPKLVFYTTIEIRSIGYLAKLNYLFEKYGLEYDQINLKNFNANKYTIAGSTIAGSHDIVLLKVKQSNNPEKNEIETDHKDEDYSNETPVKPLVPY